MKSMRSHGDEAPKFGPEKSLCVEKVTPLSVSNVRINLAKREFRICHQSLAELNTTYNSAAYRFCKPLLGTSSYHTRRTPDTAHMNAKG